MMANEDIRLYARGHGVPFWKIAAHMEISEPTLTRRLRVELCDDEKAKYKKIIEVIGGSGNANVE